MKKYRVISLPATCHSLGKGLGKGHHQQRGLEEGTFSDQLIFPSLTGARIDEISCVQRIVEKIVYFCTKFVGN